MRSGFIFTVFWGAMALLSCGSDSSGGSSSAVCAAGKQESCACFGGETGVQQCKDDGSGWGSCQCPDAGVPDANEPDSPEADAPDVSDDVESEAAPCTEPTLYGIAPQQAALRRETSFTLSAGCLASTATPAVPNCEGLVVESVSETEVKFRCAPTGPLGPTHGALFENSGGKIVGEFDIEVVYGADRQSCDEPLTCNGPNGPESCCAAIPLPAGTYMRGRSLDGTDKCPDGWPCQDNELPEHMAKVNAFSLDTYEVTLGRFRKFLEFYDGTPPPEGVGVNSSVPGSGWNSAWNGFLPASRAELEASLNCYGNGEDIWTSTPGIREKNPIQCINWYTAFAFCIWDGGRLPTETEREYVAAGGSENRLFPWGQELPDETRIKMSCATPPPCHPPEIEDVGARPGDIGKWGHVDLAGGLVEWVLDGMGPCEGYELLGGLCDNCACLDEDEDEGMRRARGGGIGDPKLARVPDRNFGVADLPLRLTGVRCAR